MLVAFWRVPSCSSRKTFRSGVAQPSAITFTQASTVATCRAVLSVTATPATTPPPTPSIRLCHLVVGELGSFAAQESVKEFQGVASQNDFSMVSACGMTPTAIAKATMPSMRPVALPFMNLRLPAGSVTTVAFLAHISSTG